MTTYYIQTSAGKEGPFSLDELRKKGVSSETLICTEGGKWMPACKFEALKAILDDNAVPSYFAKHVGPKFVFSADVIKEPKTRSRITFMQLACIVLLILNGALYYYKQDASPVAATTEPPKAAPAPIKLLASVPAEQLVEQPAKPETHKVDTTNNHIRNNWSAFIKASHNAFKYYSKFGGIHRLQAIIQNKTAFPLDTVKVAIRYVKRGETFKTEHVTFYNVPEYGEIALPAPNSRSGTSVELNITEISSEKLQFFYNAADTLASADGNLKM